MSSQIATATLAGVTTERRGAQRVADLLGRAVFSAVLLLMGLAAVAYGGADPWWKAFFTCLIFALGIFSALELAFGNAGQLAGYEILAPIIVLVGYSLVQTIPLPRANNASFGIAYRFWNSISADPYETRIFAVQLSALALLAAMLIRYAASERRLRMLTHVIIGIALVSALFGLLRQTMQHQPGFLLPQLLPDQGYGQFINKNHFAYVMEMGLGMILGLIVGGGVKRENALIYGALLAPIWTALVLANSRGGILAMIVQVLVVLLLFPLIAPQPGPAAGRTGWLLRSRAARLALVCAMIIMLLVGVGWVGGDRLATNIEAARGEFTEMDQSRAGVTRTKIWQATLQMFEASPIFGVGMGGYWAAIPQYHNAAGSMTPQQAHNDYLELASSGGLVGLGIVGWLVIVGLRKARGNLRSPERFRRAACFAALIGITGVAVHSLFDFGLHRMLNAMLFTALVVIATSNVSHTGNRLMTDA